MFPKLLNANEMRAADAFTISEQNVSSIELMERAANAFVNEIIGQITPTMQLVILCGCGNNGGDGLAVSRILQNKGYHVTPYLVQFKEELSPDCQTNFQRLTNVEIIDGMKDFPDISATDVIIDALFGYGFKGLIQGWVADFVQFINEHKKNVIALDMPSGLESEGIASSTVIKATQTISFQRPKLSFFLPENAECVGEWRIVDIGLSEEYIQQTPTHLHLLNEHALDLVIPRKRQTHKGNYGHGLMVAGSKGKMGAAILSTKASLKGGAGLVSSYIPNCGYQIMQSSVPEAMCITDISEEILISSIPVNNYTSVGIGPGLGTDTRTKKIIKDILKSQTPVVLDADALNLISEDEKLIKLLHPHCVLTPHIKEFDRLAGISKTSLKRFEKQRLLTEKYECVIVLKDAYTSIISPVTGNQYLNTSGSAGMATGGSGDVLTGLITGLLAQGYSPIDAALIGVYLHGIAGEEAALIHGENSMTASDILDCIKF